jgi:acetyl-CoA carboxylase biotin carboxyl carrier protein
MELTRLKALIDLVSSSTVTELEITEGGVRVRIAKSLPSPQPVSSGPISRKAPPAPPVQPPPPSPPSKTPASAHAVKSPMFGIFHRAPSPDAPPYVQIGGQVRAGDTLCLVEAMKSFNAITADRDGTVTAITVDNGQEVEPGQVLIEIGA